MRAHDVSALSEQTGGKQDEQKRVSVLPREYRGQGAQLGGDQAAAQGHHTARLQSAQDKAQCSVHTCGHALFQDRRRAFCHHRAHRQIGRATQ